MITRQLFFQTLDFKETIDPLEAYFIRCNEHVHDKSNQNAKTCPEEQGQLKKLKLEQKEENSPLSIVNVTHQSQHEWSYGYRNEISWDPEDSKIGIISSTLNNVIIPNPPSSLKRISHASDFEDQKIREKFGLSANVVVKVSVTESWPLKYKFGSLIAFAPSLSPSETSMLIKCLQCSFSGKFVNCGSMIELIEQHFQVHHPETEWDGYCATCKKYVIVPLKKKKKDVITVRNEMIHLKCMHITQSFS